MVLITVMVLMIRSNTLRVIVLTAMTLIIAMIVTFNRVRSDKDDNNDGDIDSDNNSDNNGDTQ